MTKNKILAVTGMTGVGKDYLVERANQEYEVGVVNWGSLIGDELEVNRDLMASTHSAEEIEAAQFAVCQKIVDMQPVVATCHTIRPLNGEYTYNLEVEQKLNPAGYVFISAPPELIAERIRKRNDEGSRKSQEMSIDEIFRIQQIKLLAVHSLARALDCRFVVLNNTELEFESSVRSLQKEIGKISTRSLQL